MPRDDHGFVAAELRDRHRRPEGAQPTDRVQPLDRQPRERPAVAALGRDQRLDRLDRDRVATMPAAGRQALPGAVDHARKMGAAAQEHRVGSRQATEGVGRAPVRTSRCGTPTAIALRAARAARSARASMPIARLVEMPQQPLDRDRAGAAADIPQRFAGAGAPMRTG